MMRMTGKGVDGKKVLAGKGLYNGEGTTGKHERHGLMVYECNEMISSLWSQR